MGAYVQFEAIRVRLVGKVSFTEDADNENAMSTVLANRLIAESEGEVEMDLSPRFSAPFQTEDGQPFARLPKNPTQEIIRTLCELKSTIRILETDFGSGSTVDASKYADSLQKRYDKILEKVVGRKKVNGQETNQWLFPPMTGLQLAPHNMSSDDGFGGQILSTSDSDGRGDFPQKQINSPSENFWTGKTDS